MPDARKELEAIIREVLAPGKELTDLIPQASALRALFERLTQFSIDPTRDIAAGETRLDSGLAISPTLAAMCIREPFRTLAFLRGLAEAIGDSLRPDRPVCVLYAGCGPFALLAVPLMTVFSREQAMFTLLDVHQECIDTASVLVESLGLCSHLDGMICGDAAHYMIPADGRPDIIVSETMAVCLQNEPQVAIARNLVGQAPEALMIPQSVSVTVCLLDRSKEHVLMPADYVGEIPMPERDRVQLGGIFELDAASIRNWCGVAGERLPAGRVRLPKSPDDRYRICLMTGIEIYGKHRLRDYDSSLTIPQPLRGRSESLGGKSLQFYYKLGASPGLGYEVLN